MSNYEIQARNFLKKANAIMSITDKHEVGREGAWSYRLYRVTIKRDSKLVNGRFNHYSFDFKSGIGNKSRPSAYDVLSCVEKFPVEPDVWDFANEYGYTINSKESYQRVCKVHKACQTEYRKLLDLFGNDLMEELQKLC